MTTTLLPRSLASAYLRAIVPGFLRPLLLFSCFLILYSDVSASAARRDFRPEDAGPGPRKESMEQSILYYVNRHRQSMRLAPLVMNATESAVAAGHSRNMASGRTPFGHTGFHDRVKLLNRQLGPIHLAAENVAYGQMSAREVVDGWLHSPGHRRNIEGNFRLTGIGLARSRQGRIYYTQLFTR